MPPEIREEDYLSGNPQLDFDDVQKLHARMRRVSQKHFREAASLYQGKRQRFRRRVAENSQIISEVGLTGAPYNFTWEYIPPADGGWRTYPGVRPWNFIALHSLAATADDRELNRNKKLLFPRKYPIDKYGHNPAKWATAQRIFFYDPGVRRVAGRNVGIHFMVSRRGDVIVSAGLNDIAHHMAGTEGIFGGRNPATVGIELELLRYRKVAGGPILFNPYPERQLLALAIILRKIEAVRPIKRQHISTRNGPLLPQTKAAGSGYVIHSEVKPANRKDPGAQFNIPQGQPGSGWDQLFGLMSKIRSFNLATEVFVQNLNPAENKSVPAIASALPMANAGSQAALRAVWAQANALRRATAMANQGRQHRSSSALAQISTITDRVTAATAALLNTVQSFNVDSLPSMKNALVFNEETNTWEKV